MDDYGSGGLSVLLRYINIASPVSPDSDRPDWVALRAVAELGYLNGALQHTDYPLLRTAASCGYLRSTDSRAGLSHPLLFQLSELGSMSTLSSLYQRSLVEELVANVVHNAAAYPNLQRLGQAISSGRASQTPPSQSPQLTPQSQTPLPTLVKSPVTSAPPARPTTSDRPQPVGTSRYPALHLLNKAASHAHHTTLLSFTGEFLHSTTNPFETQQEQLAEAENYYTGELSSPTSIAPRNIALLFTKPHAFGNATQELVEATLAQHHVRVDHSGTIPTETIDEEGIIDRHYAAIANYACKFAPSMISMTPNGAAAFAGAFGEPWSDAIQATRILNASQAAAHYGSQLTEVWKSSRPTKLMPGLYAGRAADGHYILNGFYLANREKFTRGGGFVNWYVISWEERTLHWKSFRGDLVGPTNPASAPATSLRGRIFADWRELQLGYAPNVSDNGIHASAGPLEGLAERLIWLPGHTLWSDPFGRALARHGVAPAFVQSLLKNPEVELADGRKGLIFDLLEDTQSSDAVTILFALQQRMMGADVATVLPLELLARSNTDPTLQVLEVLAPQSHVQGKEVSAVPESSVAPAPVEKPSVASNVAVPIRPHPPRTISSPYHYGQRTCGAGLESVFRYTLQYLSSRRFAAQEGQTPQAVQQSFFGLRALHAAVISVKQSTAPDPYLQISTTTWMLSLKNVEHSYAASQLPPLRPPPQGGAERFVPRPPNTVRSLESTGYEGGTSGALTARGRLTTADRIRRRTNKLQDEIVAINQRHDARTQEHLRQSPRNRPVLPNSPRRPSEVPQPQATKRPKEKALTEDPLPALRSEKIALVLSSKKSVVKQSNAQ